MGLIIVPLANTGRGGQERKGKVIWFLEPVEDLGGTMSMCHLVHTKPTLYAVVRSSLRDSRPASISTTVNPTNYQCRHCILHDTSTVANS